MSTAHNWITVTDSRYPWEQDALEFVRQRFPTHEPYRAWSNFEFIADDGSINEVDLLVFTPQGFFLVEIKSRPGVLTGDTHTWTWRHDGHSKVVDNPLFLANQKAKKLVSSLAAAASFREVASAIHRAPDFLLCRKPPVAASGERPVPRVPPGPADRPGIMAAFNRRECPGLSKQPRGTFDRPTAKAVSRALEQIGIRPSQRSRRVGDYELQGVIDEGPGYQDFLGKHVALKDTFRRIRIYLVQAETDQEQRVIIQRAAEREFRLLQTLEHRGVLAGDGVHQPRTWPGNHLPALSRRHPLGSLPHPAKGTYQ